MSTRVRDLLQKLILTLSLVGSMEVVNELLGQGFRWRPYGNNPSNYVVARNGADRPRLHIEPGTNAVDALIEAMSRRAVLKGEGKPEDQADAIQRFYGFHPDNLHKWTVGMSPKRQAEVRNLLWVAYLDGRDKYHPTLFHRDPGVGSTPKKIPFGLESFHHQGKAKDPTQGGEHSQGLTLMLPGCGAARYATRRPPDLLEQGADDLISVVFITLHTPRDPEELGVFRTLVCPDGSIPSLPADGVQEWDLLRAGRERKKKRELIWAPRRELLHPFSPGTLVAHFDYDMHPFHKETYWLENDISTYRNLQWFRQPFPMTEIELRKLNPKTKWSQDLHRTRIGGRAQLNKAAEAKSGPNSTIEGTRKLSWLDIPVEYEEGVAGVERVGLEWWALKRPARADELNPEGEHPENRKALSTKGRHRGIRTYFPTHPREWSVAFTHGRTGQAVHTETAVFYCGSREGFHLRSLSRYLVVHVDLNRLSKRGVFHMVNSDRSLLENSRVTKTILTAVRSALADDQELKLLAEDRLQYDLLQETQASAIGPDKLKRLIKVSLGLGFRKKPTPRKQGLDPLEVRVDGPTFLGIENSLPLLARPGKHMSINLVSDAPDGYDRMHPLRVMVVPGDIFAGIPAMTSWKGGRMIVSPRIPAGATPESEGTVILTLAAQSGADLPAITVPVKVVTPAPGSDEGGDSNSRLSPWEVVPHMRAIEDWPVDWTEETIADVHLQRQGTKDTLHIFVNTAHRDFVAGCRTKRYKPARLQLMRQELTYSVCLYIIGVLRLEQESSWGAAHHEPGLESHFRSWLGDRFASAQVETLDEKDVALDEEARAETDATD